MVAPEISIVIPTRNRPVLAEVAIQSVLEMAGTDVEVVVADNSDTSLEFPPDPRVRILPRPQSTLTMTDNWERALGATRGEWVTFLSDKHRLVPEVYLRVLELVKAAQLRVATFERACLYQELASDAITVDALWQQKGTLFCPDAPESYETRDARATMAEWYRIIRGAPHRPQIYRGIVHRSVIEAVLRKTSRFFFGTCPDYASGLQSMSEIENYVATNLPAVVVQVPTADVSAWSPAQSLDEGGKLGTERVREAGHESFARHHLPLTVTSAILETLLEFRRLRPEACRDVRVDWRRYTWLASNEIESMKALPWFEALRLHALVARASQTDGLDLRSLSTQARVIVSRRGPGVAAGYLWLKQLFRLSEPEPKCAPWGWHYRPVASLSQARVELAHAFGARERAVS